MPLPQRIAFIGAGNMAGSLIEGLISAGTWPPLHPNPLLLEDYEDPTSHTHSMAAVAPVGRTGLFVTVATPLDALDAVVRRMADRAASNAEAERPDPSERHAGVRARTHPEALARAALQLNAVVDTGCKSAAARSLR